MLVPVQKSGSRPPLFFVHGQHGVMPLGRFFAGVLASNQPLYVIHANGIDGRQSPIDDFRTMVLAYVEEIQETCPRGPIRIGGLCQGSLVALEITRELRTAGRETDPVILVDPNTVFHRLPEMKHIRQGQRPDVRHPLVRGQLYQQVRMVLSDYGSRPYNDLPFDCADPEQLHVASLAGLACVFALAAYTPTPYPGPVAVIVSKERAARFFHPELPWHRLLVGPRKIQVLPWEHGQMLQEGREDLARLIKIFVDKASNFQIEADQKRIVPGLEAPSG
jgi:thioesterase domain-containing protein